ncbi:MAG: glucose-1-phosphate cytidylyltransferase [Acidobacteria bacterium]|nr:glucose-1-phosphate cytidylyltransferase [Acidobacteriota bacterium]
MKVVILCGGLGTRLREETEYRPKPMVPVGGRPILWHIMKHYAHFGHREFILCLGYKGEVIKDFFRNYHWNTSDVTMRLGRNPETRYHSTHPEEDWTVTMLETGLETQTGGRLRRALEHISEERFLLTYGDGLADCDINSTLQFHVKHGAVATLTAVRPAGRFGELALAGDGVTAFREKPEVESGYINGGFFVLDRRVAEYLDPEDSCVFERQPLERLARKGQLKACCHNGFWQCMDTYREQQLLENMWQTGKAPWKVW